MNNKRKKAIGNLERRYNNLVQKLGTKYDFNIDTPLSKAVNLNANLTYLNSLRGNKLMHLIKENTTTKKGVNSKVAIQYQHAKKQAEEYAKDYNSKFKAGESKVHFSSVESITNNQNAKKLMKHLGRTQVKAYYDMKLTTYVNNFIKSKRFNKGVDSNLSNLLSNRLTTLGVQAFAKRIDSLLAVNSEVFTNSFQYFDSDQILMKHEGDYSILKKIIKAFRLPEQPKNETLTWYFEESTNE